MSVEAKFLAAVVGTNPKDWTDWTSGLDGLDAPSRSQYYLQKCWRYCFSTDPPVYVELSMVGRGDPTVSICLVERKGDCWVHVGQAVKCYTTFDTEGYNPKKHGPKELRDFAMVVHESTKRKEAELTRSRELTERQQTTEAMQRALDVIKNKAK